MAPKKAAKPTKPAPKKITPPALPAMAAKGGTCGVDGYCCQGKSAAECCGGSCGGACKGGCSSWCSCHIMALFGQAQTWVSVVVATLSLAVFNWLWHGPMLLMPRYTETAYLWRPEAEMTELTPWFMVCYVLMAIAFTVVYLLTNPKNYLQGAKNGLFIMAPVAATMLMVYVTQPIPTDILQLWAVGYLLQGVLAGLALTAVGHWFCSRYGSCKI